MSLTLLQCSICPKQPSFSDTSHLLTHVSSKGHLANLHKIQVRSHRDISAARQNALYDQWYQLHDIEQLLSIRQQQKDAKQANKRPTKRQDTSLQLKSRTNMHPNMFANPEYKEIGSMFDQDIPDRIKYNPRLSAREQSSSVLLTPLRRFRHEQSMIMTSSSPSVKRSSSQDDDTFVVEDGTAGASPNGKHLKGIIWPGMDSFDAGTEEMQRKRNQKKDDSVLEKMQAASLVVAPYETVYSPSLTMRKQRHIDELEDYDSPVEGEMLLLKQPLKRKRRLPTQDQRLKSRKSTNRRTDPVRRPRIPAFYSQDSYTTLQQALHGGIVSPDLRGDRHDISPTGSQFSGNASGMANPFFSTDRPFLSPSRTLISPATASWLQPPFLTTQHCDPFKGYRMTQPSFTGLPTWNSPEGHYNPLSWNHGSSSNLPVMLSPIRTPLGSFDEFDPGLGSLADLYSTSRNPLSAAMQHYDGAGGGDGHE